MRQFAASRKRLVSKPHSFITGFPAEGDLQHARQRGAGRGFADRSSDREHEHGRKRRHAEVRIHRRRERQRSDGKRENACEAAVLWGTTTPSAAA